MASRMSIFRSPRSRSFSRLSFSLFVSFSRSRSLSLSLSLSLTRSRSFASRCEFFFFSLGDLLPFSALDRLSCPSVSLSSLSLSLSRSRSLFVSLSFSLVPVLCRYPRVVEGI